jgi:predicted metal-dependent hydrolase
MGASHQQIELRGRRIDYRLVVSRSARRLRLRVGPNGVEVLQPANRTSDDISIFLNQHKAWILDQLKRVDRLQKVSLAHRNKREILFLGKPTLVRIEETPGKTRGNLVRLVDDEIVVQCSSGSRTPVARSLENWLRSRARTEIEKQLELITSRIGQRPRSVYIMGQRTKWGNCSAGRNLSFNWRLILAPEFVLRYLVIHEAVHLVVPDHSTKFWLTVQSYCSDTEQAKRWLRTNALRLAVKLNSICER